MSTAVRLMDELLALDVNLSVEGSELVIDAPTGTLTPAHIDNLKRHKREVLELVASKEEVSWPQECLDSEKRFGQAHAKLFPLLGEGVWTPHGPGVLLQVFAGSTGVLLESNPDQITFLQKSDEVYPTKGTRKMIGSLVRMN